MQKSKNIGIALGLVVAVLMGSTTATAQTSMQASAKMAAACSIEVVDFSFGEISINSFNGALVGPNNTIRVKCSPATNYKITAPLGVGVTNENERHLTSTSEPNTYIKYSVSLGSYTFGEGDGWGRGAILGTGTGEIVIHKLWFTIRGNQPIAAPGNYADTMLINIAY